MSLPNPSIVRKRIEQIEPLEVQMAYKATYEFDARIGEVIAYKYPSDKTAHPTGQQLKVRKETFQINMNIQQEINNAFTTLMNVNRKTPTIEEVMAIKEPVAIFTVTTEKRKGGWTREIGLPLNQKYVDGTWAKQLLDYFEAHKKDSALFPFRRQEIYPIAKEAFKGLQVHIEPYNRPVLDEQGNYVYEEKGNGEKKLKTETVHAHSKMFSQHSLRKVRRTELEKSFGFTKEERKYYGGWSLGIEERYGLGDWRISFPKLLQPQTT
jgi:hypothetical protein